MKFPTIHLNGTSAQGLYDAWDEARSAVDEAIRKLAEAAPNGRDYYMQEAGAFQVAQDEHFARMQKLVDVQTDLLRLMEHASNEMARRSRR